MQPIKNIANKIAGLCLNEEQKLDLLREALESKNLDLIEAALLKGAKPRVREIHLRLIRDDCPLTEKEFIQICEVFRQFESLNKTTLDFVGEFGSKPTLISSVIELTNYSTQAIKYLISCGVEPTGIDVITACREKSNPKYLKALLDYGIDPYTYFRESGEFAIACILFRVLKFQDLEKVKLISEYPYKGKMPIDVANILQELFAVAEGKVDDSQFSQEFARVAAQYLQFLREDAMQ